MSKLLARNPVTPGHQLHQLCGSMLADCALIQPKIAEGKIISELAKMMGMTPAWFTRNGK